jgi:vanillate O-demethylase monooxygenase subunit
MGDAELADDKNIIDVENFDNPAWKVTPGDAITCNANYLYLTDNLLDPSHVGWVHKSSFGATGTDDTPLDIDTNKSGVIVSRWVMDREPPPFYAALVKFDGNCDRLQHYEVRYPSIAINRSVFTPAGTGGVAAPRHEDAYLMVSYNFLTPIDDDKTRYHWFLHRNTDPEDEAITASIAAGARAAFTEDRTVLEAVQIGMADKTRPTLNLAIDAGSVQFRHNLQKLIAAEQDQSGGQTP